MSKIIFILGGARSGKSRFAIEQAKGIGKKVAFIATCKPMDKEMEERISIHKKTRPANWQTFEEPRDIPLLLKKMGQKIEVIIIDCLTLLVSNLLLAGLKQKDIEKSCKDILSTLKKLKTHAIIVSNEVGLGIVPDNKLAREFRDIAGRINQVVTKEANEVFFMASGLALKIKEQRKLL